MTDIDRDNHRERHILLAVEEHGRGQYRRLHSFISKTGQQYKCTNAYRKRHFDIHRCNHRRAGHSRAILSYLRHVRSWRLQTRQSVQLPRMHAKSGSRIEEPERQIAAREDSKPDTVDFIVIGIWQGLEGSDWRRAKILSSTRDESVVVLCVGLQTVGHDFARPAYINAEGT